MPLVDERVSRIALTEAGASLPEIVSQLAAHRRQAVALLVDEEPAAVILHPETFAALVDAAQDALDLDDAEAALATEPLASFAEYHSQRLARRRPARS